MDVDEQPQRQSPKTLHVPIPSDVLQSLIHAPFCSHHFGRCESRHVLVLREPKRTAKLQKLLSMTPPEGCGSAVCTVLLCGDTHAQQTLGLLISDCYDAATALLLEARRHGLSLAHVRTFPNPAIMRSVRDLLAIPEHIIPFSATMLYAPSQEQISKEPGANAIHSNAW